MKNTLIIAAAIVVGSGMIAFSINNASLNQRYAAADTDGTKIVDQRTGDVYSPLKLSQVKSTEHIEETRDYYWVSLIKFP